jgi:hypothetical protein
MDNTNLSLFPLVLLTATVQLLLWRDKRNAAKLESQSRDSQDSDNPPLEGSDVDEKKAVRVKDTAVVSLN